MLIPPVLSISHCTWTGPDERFVYQAVKRQSCQRQSNVASRATGRPYDDELSAVYETVIVSVGIYFHDGS